VSARMNVAGIVINNGEPMRGEFSVEQDWIDVTTCSGERKPDLGWTHTDAAGHFHAYDHEGELPTLRLVHRKRKPSVYRCLLCNKKVEPAVHVDYGRKQIPGRQDWTLTVFGLVPRERFSFRLVGGEREYFGHAEMFTEEFGPDAATARCAAYPVSWRKAGDAA
jgi:hypothetical protein